MRYYLSFLLLALWADVVRVHELTTSEYDESNGDQILSRKRESVETIRKSIATSTGTKKWEGITSERLPLFGIHPKEYRRKLTKKGISFTSRSPATSSSPSPTPVATLDDEFDIYGIGVTEYQVRATSKSTKASAKGKGQTPTSRPTAKPVSWIRPTTRPVQRPTVRPTPQPTLRQAPFATPTRTPTARPTAATPEPICTITINIDFLQFSAIPPAIFVDPGNPNEQTLGTRYVYNDGLRDQDTLDEFANSRGSGTCTRTQARIGDESIGLQLGRGYCVFEYSLTDSQNREITFTASGDVADSIGGILSITGGSRTTLGAYGEIELLPVNLLPDGNFEIETGDFFLDPVFYLADATVFVPCT